MAQNTIKWSKHGRLLDTREIGAKGDRLARDSSTSQELPPDLPHGSRYAAAIMASRLVGARAGRGRPAFTSTVGVTRADAAAVVQVQ